MLFIYENRPLFATLTTNLNYYIKVYIHKNHHKALYSKALWWFFRHNVCQLKIKKDSPLADVGYAVGINPTAQSHNQGGES
jgi:hypothetical protein